MSDTEDTVAKVRDALAQERSDYERTIRGLIITVWILTLVSVAQLALLILT